VYTEKGYQQDGTICKNSRKNMFKYKQFSYRRGLYLKVSVATYNQITATEKISAQRKESSGAAIS
jgi:hypothetical protein